MTGPAARAAAELGGIGRADRRQRVAGVSHGLAVAANRQPGRATLISVDLRKSAAKSFVFLIEEPPLFLHLLHNRLIIVLCSIGFSSASCCSRPSALRISFRMFGFRF